MEAMYCGLPIICTNSGGQTDFLKYRKNAIIIDVGDVEACSNAIQELRKNNTLYQHLAKNNKKDVKNYYAEPIAERYMKIFKNMAGREYFG